MRRLLALLLTALFGLSPISPAVFAQDPDSKLPACCRRGGKHPCAQAASQTESGPGFVAGRCAFFPSGQAAPTSSTVSLPGIAPAIFAGLDSHPTSRPQVESLFRITYNRAAQKRGPPSLT